MRTTIRVASPMPSGYVCNTALPPQYAVASRGPRPHRDAVYLQAPSAQSSWVLTTIGCRDLRPMLSRSHPTGAHHVPKQCSFTFVVGCQEVSRVATVIY